MNNIKNTAVEYGVVVEDDELVPPGQVVGIQYQLDYITEERQLLWRIISELEKIREEIKKLND